MKRRLLAGLLALSCLLTGCAALLEQEYVHITPHDTAPTAEGDPSILRAESYQELVNALLYFVTTGAETGSVRLYMDSEDIEAQLEAACLEVVQEDPLGAYAVDYIKYSVNPVVTYAQADVEIIYRRTREQVGAIVSVTGVTAIRSELTSALTSFAPERALRISYFDGDEDFIRTLARQAYYDTPASALDFPEMAVSIYPDAGRQRIVEIGLTYHLDPLELEERKQALSQELQRLGLLLTGGGSEPHPLEAAQAVLEAGSLSPEGGNTAYHALVEGEADSEGLSLAFAALCEHLGLSCHVAEGVLEEAPHFWNVVSLEEGWRHLDLTQMEEAEEGSEDSPLRLDSQLLEAGYQWDASTLPQCVSGPALDG